jgi:hypothetical protein
MNDSSSKSFFLHLPSNDKSHVENTANNYRITLPSAIDLRNQQWEVALTEIMCSGLTSNKMTTTLEHEFPFMVDILHNASPIDSFEKLMRRSSFAERSGPFVSWNCREREGRHLAEWKIKNSDFAAVKLELSSTFLSSFEITKYQINSGTEINIEEAKNLHIFLQPEDELKIVIDYDIFSLQMDDTVRKKMAVKLPFIIKCTLIKEENLKEKILIQNTINRHLYVYTNIVEYQVVGNGKAPLLRVIDSEILKNQTTFVNPYYLPVSVGTINEISIFLFNSQGKPVDFRMGGRVVAILHFRPRL